MAERYETLASLNIGFGDANYQWLNRTALNEFLRSSEREELTGHFRVEYSYRGETLIATIKIDPDNRDVFDEIYQNAWTFATTQMRYNQTHGRQ